MPCKMWDAIFIPFPNFDGCTVEVWEWLSNLIPIYNECIYLFHAGSSSILTKVPLGPKSDRNRQENFALDECVIDVDSSAFAI